MGPRPQRIAVLCKPQVLEAARTGGELRAWLRERGLQAHGDVASATLAGQRDGLPGDELGTFADLAVVLGGDGTLLLAARTFAPYDVPILGINLGRLGFLSDTDQEHMYEVLERVLDGDYTTSDRLMLQGAVRRPSGEVLQNIQALNDLVINKGALAQAVRLETRIDGHFVSTYIADGLIISTPTGSTAYGLAVGGPIIVPNTAVMQVAPICPHMLTNRPIVVGADSTIEATLVEARDEVYLTIDGQQGVRLAPGDSLVVTRAPKLARLVQCAAPDFFSILRQKMRWGAT